jgi:hypothetical protein
MHVYNNNQNWLGMLLFPMWITLFTKCSPAVQKSLGQMPWDLGQHAFTVLWVTIIIMSTIANFDQHLHKSMSWTTGIGVTCELAIIFFLKWCAIQSSRLVSKNTCKMWLDVMPTAWVILENVTIIPTHAVMAIISGLLVVGTYYNM